jgi:hypothetical protein
MTTPTFLETALGGVASRPRFFVFCERLDKRWTIKNRRVLHNPRKNSLNLTSV